jgi:hypothetical protein
MRHLKYPYKKFWFPLVHPPTQRRKERNVYLV